MIWQVAVHSAFPAHQPMSLHVHECVCMHADACVCEHAHACTHFLEDHVMLNIMSTYQPSFQVLRVTVHQCHKVPWIRNTS